MSGQTGKWKEEQILIVCPGSQTTMAQLGCNDLTPPVHKIPTRMFKDEENDKTWRPVFTYKRRKGSGGSASIHSNATTGASEMNGKGAENEWEYIEDPDSDEGAVYPMRGGHIVNMDAFLAFLDHIHARLTTSPHATPILMMASPQWSKPDCEVITSYIFERTKTPALCMMHSGVAAQYGLKWPNMTVVDIGFEKVDVTCIYDYCLVSQLTLGGQPQKKKREISGGEVFTRKLLSLLQSKGFNYDMAEQLKKSPICEVLPYVADKPNLMTLPSESGGASCEPSEAPKIETSHPVVDAEDDGALGVDPNLEDEGILDVANIVVSGNAREFLAKKEKEKERRNRKGKAVQEADVGSREKLANSQRVRNTFHYEELITEDKIADTTAADSGKNGDEDLDMAEVPASSAKASELGPQLDKAQMTASGSAPVPERTTRRVRRDIEVGLERFLFADREEIDRIARLIYRAVQKIEDMYMRPSCWENLVFVGNGSRLRGLRENILQTLQARHLISPSTASMFTSELPSNLGTPMGTGSQTPTGSFNASGGGGGVKPLLQAATMAAMQQASSAQAMQAAGAAPPGHEGAMSMHFHSQTPTAIKLAPLPTYLSEWTKNGYEEAMFLGAQVAGRMAFAMHHTNVQDAEAQKMMSLTRVDYNEMGPKAIRVHSMLT